MNIEENALKHWIDHFFGYGAWCAKVWFVGLEESGGEVPEEVAEKLNHFYNVHASTSNATLCDIRELYWHVAARLDGPRARLFTNLYEYRFGDNATLHGLWKNIIAFVHGYGNKKLPDLLTYQKNSFASSSIPNEALISLYPLPSSNHHAWYYAWLDMPRFPFLKSRALYHEHLYQKRVQGIFSNISTYKPEVVVMYGMDNINVLKESVQAVFPVAKFKMVKAVKRQIPQHHRANLNGTILVITTQIPALRHNRIESGFDWEVFGKCLRA